MIVRACCNNCGFVGDNDVPYRAQVTSATIGDDRAVEGESSFKLEDGTIREFLCVNCGRPALEVVYWDKTRKKDPFIGRLERVVDG